MKKYLLIVLVVLGGFFSQGQEKDTVFIQLVGIGGGYGETSNGNSLSYSMGELMVATTTNYNQTFTQGFQQNSFKAVVGIIEQKDITINIEAYPNPTTDFLNIKISSQNKVSAMDYEIEFLDLVGKQISLNQDFINESTIKLDLKELPSGMYLANLKNRKTSKIVSSFKITKTSFN